MVKLTKKKGGQINQKNKKTNDLETRLKSLLIAQGNGLITPKEYSKKIINEINDLQIALDVDLISETEYHSKKQLLDEYKLLEDGIANKIEREKEALQIELDIQLITDEEYTIRNSLLDKTTNEELHQMLEFINDYQDMNYNSLSISKKNELNISTKDYRSKPKATIEKCNNHALPIFTNNNNNSSEIPIIRDCKPNDDIISILGPVGLDYIQYKNTEIFLFPEKHSDNADEDKIRNSSVYKNHIHIETLYHRLLSQNLCIDMYHEGFSYRNKYVSRGGGTTDSYESFYSTSSEYKPYLYSKTEKSKNFFHYGEFRLRRDKGNFSIWDILSNYNNYDGAETRHKTLMITYLYKPKLINKLAKCYYLDNDFERSIKNIFPEPIVNSLFNFNGLKLYNGSWIHPIRKEIMECPYKTQLESFISSHIDTIYSRQDCIDLIKWYMGDNWNNEYIIGNFIGLFDLDNCIDEHIFFDDSQLYFTTEQKHHIMINLNIFRSLDYIMKTISLVISDLLVDVYNLARLLRYIDQRNTNIVLYYGGWAHPWTTRKFFLEKLNTDPNLKLYHTYGLHHQNNSFFGNNWLSYEIKDYRKNYSFEMPYTDFQTLFMRDMEQWKEPLPIYKKNHPLNGFEFLPVNTVYHLKLNEQSFQVSSLPETNGDEIYVFITRNVRDIDDIDKHLVVNPRLSNLDTEYYGCRTNDKVFKPRDYFTKYEENNYIENGIFFSVVKAKNEKEFLKYFHRSENNGKIVLYIELDKLLTYIDTRNSEFEIPLIYFTDSIFRIANDRNNKYYLPQQRKLFLTHIRNISNDKLIYSEIISKLPFDEKQLDFKYFYGNKKSSYLNLGSGIKRSFLTNKYKLKRRKTYKNHRPVL